MTIIDRRVRTIEGRVDEREQAHRDANRPLALTPQDKQVEHNFLDVMTFPTVADARKYQIRYLREYPNARAGHMYLPEHPEARVGALARAIGRVVVIEIEKGKYIRQDGSVR